MSKPGISLLKVGLIQSFDFRRKDKIKTASFFIPIILFFIVGSLLSLTYSLSFSFMLLSAGRKESLNLVLYALAGISSMITLVTGITKVRGTLFGGTDYDMLASLPIPKRNIITVKFISLYLVQLFYTAIFVLPAMLVTSILGKQPLLLMEGMLLLIFSPCIPLLLAGILGMTIGLISDRFRFGNIISLVFYVGFLGAVMYSSFVFNTQGEEEINIEAIYELLSIMRWLNPSSMLFALNFGVLNSLFYFLGNAITLVIMILIFAKCYDYCHFLMTARRVKNTYVQKDVKRKGQFKALFLMDLKRYFSSKMYLMNTITGGVMCILLTVVMIISFKNIKDPEALKILSSLAPYFVLINAWCIGLGVPSSVSINAEGKTMWQVKVLPISYQSYAKSKILLSYTVLAPFLLVSSCIWIFFMDITIENILLTFVFPQIYLFSMSIIGFLINTYFYKLKWTNEIEAVKNSAGMLLTMLIDLAYTGILCVLLILPGLFGFFTIGVLLTLIFVIVAALTFWVLVHKLCEKSIESIEC